MAADERCAFSRFALVTWMWPSARPRASTITVISGRPYQCAQHVINLNRAQSPRVIRLKHMVPNCAVCWNAAFL